MEKRYGYLKGTYARDKDAVVAAMLICEMAADYQSEGMTLYDGLQELYKKYGYCEECLVTKTLYGEEGSIRIKEIMTELRTNPPKEIGGDEIIKVLDYNDGIDGLPKSNVLKLVLTDGWFAVRPSGTEPKIKFYCGFNGEKSENVKAKLKNVRAFVDGLK